jgi:hypothetical protein
LLTAETQVHVNEKDFLSLGVANLSVGTDEIKLLLADPQVFDILLHLMGKSNSTEERASLENVTSDLIVLLLTGGKS